MFAYPSSKIGNDEERFRFFDAWQIVKEKIGRARKLLFGGVHRRVMVDFKRRYRGDSNSNI